MSKITIKDYNKTVADTLIEVSKLSEEQRMVFSANMTFLFFQNSTDVLSEELATMISKIFVQLGTAEQEAMGYEQPTEEFYDKFFKTISAEELSTAIYEKLDSKDEAKQIDALNMLVQAINVLSTMRPTILGMILAKAMRLIWCNNQIIAELKKKGDI